jgi:hypothetical protein
MKPKDKQEIFWNIITIIKFAHRTDFFLHGAIDQLLKRINLTNKEDVILFINYAKIIEKPIEKFSKKNNLDEIPYGIIFNGKEHYDIFIKSTPLNLDINNINGNYPNLAPSLALTTYYNSLK